MSVWLVNLYFTFSVVLIFLVSCYLGDRDAVALVLENKEAMADEKSTI